MRFPLFIDLKDKSVLVVGGGRIGGRRADICVGLSQTAISIPL